MSELLHTAFRTEDSYGGAVTRRRLKVYLSSLHLPPQEIHYHLFFAQAILCFYHGNAYLYVLLFAYSVSWSSLLRTSLIK